MLDEGREKEYTICPCFTFHSVTHIASHPPHVIE